jgi:hypothetical protein
VTLLAGCTGYGVVHNLPITQVEPGKGYSFEVLARKQGRNAGELSLAVAFSGGGTRAASLSYAMACCSNCATHKCASTGATSACSTPSA